MTDLSPAAQAVLDASKKHGTFRGLWKVEYRNLAAAVLRAAADQVVPEQPEPTKDSDDYGIACVLSFKAKDVRMRLVAIADELEGGNS